MERFPVLGLIVRYGLAASIAVAVLVGVGLLALLWPVWGPIALAPAVLAGGLGYIVCRSYVELVLLITDMLLPR